jgi:hypothetical protein
LDAKDLGGVPLLLFPSPGEVLVGESWVFGAFIAGRGDEVVNRYAFTNELRNGAGAPDFGVVRMRCNDKDAFCGD